MSGGEGRRTPGRQARRSRRGLWIGFAVCAVLAVLLLGLAVWVVVAVPGGGDPDEAVWGGAILGAAALLLAGAAWYYLMHKLRPPVLKNVSLAVSPTEVRRGEHVQARVRSTGARRKGATLEVALICTELYDVKERRSNPNGADYDQRVTREYELHRETRPVEGASLDVSFEIPAGGAFSYEGDCISAIWSVRATERRPNRRDRRQDEHVQVTP